MNHDQVPMVYKKEGNEVELPFAESVAPSTRRNTKRIFFDLVIAAGVTILGIAALNQVQSEPRPHMLIKTFSDGRQLVEHVFPAGPNSRSFCDDAAAARTRDSV